MIGGRFLEEFSKIPPASLEWRPFRATANLSGPSRASGMARKILWLENAVGERLRMAALMALTGLVRQTPWKQHRLARSASRRPPEQANDSQSLFSRSNHWILEFSTSSDAAGPDGASRAHQTSGESLGAEKITERTLRMTARMMLSRAGAQEASAAALAHQGRSQECPGSST